MPIDPKQTKLAVEIKHETPLLSCAFDASGRFVLAGGRDRGLLAFQVETQEKSVLTGHESWVGVASRAGELVLTGDYAGRVIGWDCAGKTPKPRWTIAAHPSTVYGLSVSADGKTFATSDRDGLVRIWQTHDGKPRHELPRVDHPVYCVALLADDKRIVTADRRPQKPRVKVWDFTTGKEQISIDVAELSGYRRVEDIEWGGIRALTVSPDGESIIACGRAGYDGQATSLVYGTDDGKLRRKLSAALKGGFYYSAQFHPEGFLLTAGGDLAKGEVRFWNLDQDASLGEITTPGPCMAVALHPNGRRFAASQMNMPKGSYPDSGALAIYDWTA